jgi:hypothetical protein
MLNRFMHSPFAVPAALLVAATIFFAPVWFTDADLAGSDFQQIHYPLLNFVVDNIHDSGEVPLWNPHQFLGYSVVGNPQYGLLYPPNWLLLAFPGEQLYLGVALLAGLHMFWLALGTFTLARQWGASRIGGLVAGLVVAFSGYTASKLYAGHYAVLLTLAWLPWVLAGVHLALQKSRAVWIMPGAAALGLSILAGHPQFVYISAYGVGGITLYHLLNANSTAQRLRQLRQVALLGAVGVVLGAGALLPAYDYQSQTVRGQAADTREFANQHAVPPQQLGALLVADIFGTPTTETGYWGEPFYEEMTTYVGLLPLLLLYFTVRWRPRGWWLWGGFVIFGLWMSLGQGAGLYALQYEGIPPARGFRAPGRFLLLTTLGFGMLTALTITQMQAQGTLARGAVLRRVFLPAILTLGGGAVIFVLFGDTLQDDPAHGEHIAQQLGVSVGFVLVFGAVIWLWNEQRSLAVALMLVGVGANLWWAAAPLRNIDDVMLSPVWQRAETLPLNAEPHTYGRIMQTGSPPGIINGASWIDAYSPQGYDPIAPAGWFALMDATGRFIEEPASATNRLFNVRYVVAGQPLENYGFVAAQFFEPISVVDNLYFYENPQPLPRAYLVPAYGVEADDSVAIQRIQRGDVDRGDLVLLPEDPGCDLSNDTATGTATITNYSANSVDVRVSTETPAILVLLDQHDPDWQVRLNGNDAELLRVNTTFRGVCIPAGEHQVTFVYSPTWFWRGLALSGVGWALVLLVAVRYGLFRLKLLTHLN